MVYGNNDLIGATLNVYDVKTNIRFILEFVEGIELLHVWVDDPKDESNHGRGVKHRCRLPEDPVEFAQFIGALVARYNKQVEKANTAAADVPAIESLNQLPSH